MTVTLFGKGVLAHKQVKIGSREWVPNQYDCVLIKRKKSGHEDTHRVNALWRGNTLVSHRILHMASKPAEASREARIRFSFKVLRRNQPCWHLTSQTCSFQKWETVNLYCLKHTHLRHFVKAALESQYSDLCMCLSFQYLLSGIKRNSIQFLRLLWKAHVTKEAKWLAHVRCSTGRNSSHIRTPTISD